MDVAATWEPIDSLTPHPKNPRHNDGAVDEVADSIRTFGFGSPIIARTADRVIIAGHTRWKAAAKLGMDKVPVRFMDLDPARAAALMLADNKLGELAEWDDALLSELAAEHDLDLTTLGWSDEEAAGLLGSDVLEASGHEERPTLFDRFLVPPFSVLDARQGYWQTRKAMWLAVGIASELGRDRRLLKGGWSGIAPAYYADKRKKEAEIGRTLTNEEFNRIGGSAGSSGMGATGTSTFDPVLAELACRWFCPQGGVVLDPFAGGSVRGIVSAMCGRRYVGVDLRPEQVDENIGQWQAIGAGGDAAPLWIVGDSAEIQGLLPDGLEADMLLSCPPYGDLERYSDDPNDLSTMDPDAFDRAHAAIIRGAADRLRPDSFAVWVVGDYRDKRGNMRGFVASTIDAFRAAGMEFYNDMVLVTSVGSTSIRVGVAFDTSRKAGKVHQNVLVFVKGDAKAATAKIGKVDYADAAEMTDGAGPGTLEPRDG